MSIDPSPPGPIPEHKAGVNESATPAAVADELTHAEDTVSAQDAVMKNTRAALTAAHNAAVDDTGFVSPTGDRSAPLAAVVIATGAVVIGALIWRRRR